MNQKHQKKVHLFEPPKILKDYTKPYDFLFKLLIIGDSGVGKSSLLTRFSDDDFDQLYLSTIGIDFRLLTIMLDNKIIKLQIWDTAGQERFRTITASYYRGAHGILLVYDISNRESFENISYWLKQIHSLATNQITIILLGNKSDLNDEHRKVQYQEGLDLANSIGIKFLETSAKDNNNVEEAFFYSAREIKRKINSLNDHLIFQNSSITLEPTIKLRKKCCF